MSGILFGFVFRFHIFGILYDGTAASGPPFRVLLCYLFSDAHRPADQFRSFHYFSSVIQINSDPTY